MRSPASLPAVRRSRLSGIIFDLDGTLVDSKLDFDAIRKDMGLPAGLAILESLERIPSGTQKDRMLQTLRTHELQAAERSEVFAGVVEFLAWLDERKIPRGILTRNSRESTDITLGRHRLRFDNVLTREDAPPKPDPSGLLAICSIWQAIPAEIAFCGDYLFDLDAGFRAGMRTILFAPNALPDYADRADLVLREFCKAAEVIEEYFQVG